MVEDVRRMSARIRGSSKFISWVEARETAYVVGTKEKRRVQTNRETSKFDLYLEHGTHTLLHRLWVPSCFVADVSSNML